VDGGDGVAIVAIVGRFQVGFQLAVFTIADPMRLRAYLKKPDLPWMR
jgi:hypothetical protein